MVGSGVVPPGVLVAVRSSLDESSRIWFEAYLLYFTMPVVLGLALAAGVWRWRAGQGLRAAAARLWPGAVAAVALTEVCTPASCMRYGDSCIRASTPLGNGVASPRFRGTRAILHCGHLLGQAEATPGHIGHQNSVSAEMGDETDCRERVSLSK